MVNNSTANAGNARDTRLIPGSGRLPGAENGKPTPVFLLEKFHGQRSLVGYCPWSWSLKELTLRAQHLYDD